MKTAIGLSSRTLTREELAQDRKTVRRYDQCGLGDRAVYMGSLMHPRRYYIPYESITHVFKRVAASNLSGKGFLAPVLYLVVRYDDGREQQCSFRYLQDCDKMQNELARIRPDICQLSPEGERRQKEREEREKRLKNTPLSDEAASARKALEKARRLLQKSPSLYEQLAAMAKLKRRADSVRPVYQYTALGVLLCGAALMIAGAVVIRSGQGMRGIILALFGMMLMFIMVNSRALPSRITNRRRSQREYDAALAALENSLRSCPDFPLPIHYAHPYVCDRLIRILREQRAETVPEALEVLKEDLRAMDSSVALAGDEYREVVTIKPLFTCRNYE